MFSMREARSCSCEIDGVEADDDEASLSDEEFCE